MAERVVKVSLVAQVSGYLAGMEKARKATSDLGSESAKLAQRRESIETLGRGMLAVGTLAAVGVGLAVKKFADFDQAMSNVKAATQETTANMGLLRAAALDAGASTVFTATEAANAIEELGKNGLTTTQILKGGLSGALALASAGQLGVARAAEIAAISMKQFGLEGKDIPHIADLLAAGAGKAAGDVEDLAQALNQSALVAAQTGLSIEETTGLLAAFADAGLTGSDAGTALKSALQRLTPISGEAADEMDRLGISAYDSQGNFIGAAKFAGVLETKLGNLTVEQRNAAMAQIFGSDAVRAANVLYTQGADGIAKYIDQTNDSGFAAKVAADRLDNLTGDVEKLGGAFDTYLIKSGSGANDVLRSLVQGATGVVEAVGSLPEPVLAGGLALGGLVAAIGLAGGAALVAVPKAAQFKIALVELGVSARSVATGVGLIGGVIGVATVAFSMFVAEQGASAARTDSFRDSLDEATGAVTKYTRELVVKSLQEKGAFADAAKYGVSQKELTDAVIEGGNALELVNAKLNAASEGLSGQQLRAAEVAAAHGATATAVRKTAGELEAGQEEWDNATAAADDNTSSTKGAAAAYLEAADKAAELESNLTTLIDTINKSNGVGQDAVSQNIAYQDALADVDAQIAAIAAGTEGFARGLDVMTETGRTNLGMINDLAGASQSAAKAQFDLDGNTENYRSTLEAGRQAVIDRAIALGATADEAQLLADKIYAIPSEKQFAMIANTAEAETKLSGFITRWDGKKITISVGTSGNPVFRMPNGQKFEADGGVLDFYARGGMREDHRAQIAPAGAWRVWAEPETGGESYIPLSPSKRARSLDIWAETGRRLGVAGYAGGGLVTPPQYASSGGSSAFGNVTTTGDTFNATFQLAPVPGRPLADQAFEAARRLKLRR